MKELDIYKQTLKILLLTILMIVLCKITRGYFTPIFVLIGVWCAFSNKLGWALVYFVLMPFFVILNPAILPKNGSVVSFSLRLGPLLIGLCLAIGGMSRKGRHRLPFIGIIPFLMAAVISSVDGWAPKVSYLKIINYIMFLLGIWYGTQNLQHRPKDVFLLRSFFLAMAIILIIGSIVLIPIPSISYATSLGNALREGGKELAEEVYAVMKEEGMKTLFCGITNQSQALAPLLVCMLGWVTCDMLFLERSFRKLHLVLIFLSFPLLYMTRSRVALVSGAFVLGTIVVYTMHVISLPPIVQRKVRSGVMLGVGALLGAIIAVQLSSGMMGEWIRKTDDASSDKRTLAEALTASRMGLMEQSLYEFRRNPLIGSGFQVAEYTRDKVRGKGLVLSASIEKGVLPVMVLGETGILGEILFLSFLASFYWVCSQRKYFVTITLFSAFLVTNLGEATFFSPGGIGGILWMMACVGGFTIDTTLLYRRTVEQGWQNMARMGMTRPGPYGPQRPLGLR